ncbi:unnamed protein product [Prunus armeniaca]|uniref:Uncharacterized protein n=1 Tax=Prunus armeniaca TaxID=36596 RepID=A0A6J5Y345_PRUAR|nr:unnamed protein product [Prunus armeniaca]
MTTDRLSTSSVAAAVADQDSDGGQVMSSNNLSCLVCGDFGRGFLFWVFTSVLCPNPMIRIIKSILPLYKIIPSWRRDCLISMIWFDVRNAIPPIITWTVVMACLHDNEYFCAALAFDPIESNHFRVVRIDYSRQLTSLNSTSTSTSAPLDTVMDIFSSQSRQWVRHGLTSSGKILCIDLNTIKARAFDLPHGPEDDDADDNKMGATTMGMECLGISRGLVCYDDPIKPYAICPNSHVLFFGTLNWIGSCNFEKPKGGTHR